MFRNQKIVAVAIIVLLSLAALIQITWHRSHKVPLVPQGSQAEYLSKWHDMKRILLTDANIKNFVGDMLQADVLKLPPGTSKVSIDDLTAEQRQDIQEALEGFFTVYRGSDPTPVFQYLTVARGKTKFPNAVREAVIGAAKGTNPSLKLESDQDIFNFVWNFGSKGIGFGNLLESSGQIAFWETNTLLTEGQHLQHILDEPDLFKNVISFPHVFDSSEKLIQML